ncbi:MAG TPA: immunoglobulin domain-containing protein, partial [Opitutaceae bacterium]
MPLSRCLAWLGLSLVVAFHAPLRAEIPAAALMKAASPIDPGKFVFPADSSYVLDPNAANPDDHAAAIQAAIDAVKNAALSKGAVILIKPGTYHLKRPVIIRGTGVTLVGLRDVQADKTWGPYPTLTYGDDFVDADYNARAGIRGGVVDVLQYPAVIRINGNTDYSDNVVYDSHGLRGFILSYTGTDLTSAGGKATAVALHAVYHSPVQDLTITGSSHGPWNGIDTGACMMPLVHNVTITGLRGDFGIRAGDSFVGSQAQKYHGITITAPVDADSTTDLFRFRGEGELIGARFEGGRIGVDMSGMSGKDGERAGNMTLRSVLIKNSARQGIRIGNAQAIGLTDIQIDEPGAEGIKVSDTFLGGLQILNLRINGAGYSALRVQGGMNISVANAELLNSGRNKSTADATDLPIAGIHLDRPVTSFNVAGARIGSADSAPLPAGQGEDWGIYWSEAGSVNPWHAPTVIATHVNFLSNITTATRTNPRASPLPTLSIENVGGYYALHNAGFFPQPGSSRPLREDTWAVQKLPGDPEFTDPWLQVAKGYNWFDLPEIRDHQWIDLTSTAFSPAIVDASGNINASAFAALVGEAAAAYPEGVVFYLPSGKFNNLNTATPTFDRKIYRLPAGGAGLLIDKPRIQILGSGQDVTQLYVPHQTSAANLPPRDDVITFAAGSDGSGVHGLSVFFDSAAYKNPEVWAEVTYGAAFRVENTSQVRLVNLGTSYGMGSAVSLVDSSDCSLYQIWSRSAANNRLPTSPLGVFEIIGTTAGATHDIRLFQVFGSGLANVYHDGELLNWNDANDRLAYAELPEFDHVRIEGGVSRVRIDYSTFIQGKNGLTVTERSSLTPSDISACRFSTDHVQKAFDLLQMDGGDFLACWTNAAYLVTHVGEEVTGALRFSNMAFRGGNLEGLSLRGGGDVAIVNCQTGRTCNTTTLNPQESRPLTGIYIGSGVTGDVSLVGGMSGWLWYRLASVTTNGNAQDWGVVLGTGFPTDRYFSYGLDLFGNGDVNARHPASPPGYRRGVGQQASNGPSATWLTDDSNYSLAGPAPEALTITSQPQSRIVAEGLTVTFTAAATGSAPLAYRWMKGTGPLSDGPRISGATTTSLTIADLGPGDAGSYTVVVSNPFETVTSTAAILTITSLPDEPPVAPVITSIARTPFTVGVSSSFTITATGRKPVTFSVSGSPEWLVLDRETGLLSGTAPSGAAGTSLELTVSASDGAASATQVLTVNLEAIPDIKTPLTVTTLAGQAGSPGSADATGSAARFNFLLGVAADSAGNLYVADESNHTIRKVASGSGVVTTLAGQAGVFGSDDGAGATARFHSPSGIAVSTSGVLYVADTLNHTIRTVTPAGEVSTLAGEAGVSGSAEGTGTAVRFFAPQGLAIDESAGALYVADTNNHCIRKIVLSTGVVSTLAGDAAQSGSVDGAGRAARFQFPSGIAVGAERTVFVADTGNNAIR